MPRPEDHPTGDGNGGFQVIKVDRIPVRRTGDANGAATGPRSCAGTGNFDSPYCRSTGPAVLAGSEDKPTRSWIPSVEGIRAELTSVERIWSWAWCRPDGRPGTA
jgi:hypothetical protein